MRSSRNHRAAVVLVAILFCGSIAFAQSTVIRIPIDSDGRVDMSAVVARLAHETNVAIRASDVPLRLPIRGVAGTATRSLIQRGLGGAAVVADEGDAITLTLNAGTTGAAWQSRLKALAERVRREAMVGRLVYGMHTRESFRPNDKERPTVLLVHGMNSASSCFVHMVPLLEEAGFGVILYDYPDNQDVDVSAPQFVKDWKALRKQTGDAQCWAIVGHSMGALLARYYVEGDDYANDVSQLILIAPPNEGSALAKAQGVFQLLQKMQGPQGESLGTLVELSEGLGEAADDMVPGAAFLKRLNARPRRSGVAYHILAGDAGFLTQTGRQKLEAQLRTATRAVGVFGKLARLATPNLDAVLDELTDGTGDGAVSVRSTRLDSVTDHVTIHSNHVELIRGPMLYPDPGPVVCMPYLLRWLKP